MVPNSTTTKSDTSSNANATVDELMEMSPQLCSQKSTQHPQSPYSNLSSPARPQTAPNTVAATTIESSPVGSNQAARQSPQQNNNFLSRSIFCLASASRGFTIKFSWDSHWISRRSPI